MLKFEIDRSLNNHEAICNKLEQPHYGNCQLRFSQRIPYNDTGARKELKLAP